MSPYTKLPDGKWFCPECQIVDVSKMVSRFDLHVICGDLISDSILYVHCTYRVLLDRRGDHLWVGSR